MTAAAPAANRRSTLEACALLQRAMSIWPRLDRQGLVRCGCDARKIAGYVARRTSHSVEAITTILEQGELAEAEQTLAKDLGPNAGPRTKLRTFKLQAILAGDRNPALAADPELNYQDAAELQLLLAALG